MKKPAWLNKKVNLLSCRKLKETLRYLSLNTVCEESLCPNIAECFSQGVATFMILGDICTRQCSFCAVIRGRPKGVDQREPQRIAEAVKELNLGYIVVTSPSRDDLEDGGAEFFCNTIRAIKSVNSAKKVEILIPDFSGNRKSIEKVAGSGASVIAHNLETVPSLYIKVREGASYQRSLEVLRLIKELNCEVFTKSGLILGLGERLNEIIAVFEDLRKVGCDFLTLGQYLPPSTRHYPLKEYVSPEMFSYLEEKAYALGFKKVKSSPYVRSSYLAHTFIG
jgi:lipoic acid synthetase